MFSKHSTQCFFLSMLIALMPSAYANGLQKNAAPIKPSPSVLSVKCKTFNFGEESTFEDDNLATEKLIENNCDTSKSVNFYWRSSAQGRYCCVPKNVGSK